LLFSPSTLDHYQGSFINIYFMNTPFESPLS
jgi:hypothetical protein